MLFNHVILSPLLLLPSVFPSIRIFSSESALCVTWPSIGASALASVFPVSIQGWFFFLGWTGLISLQSKGLPSLFQHHNSKASILWHSAFFRVQLSCSYMTTEKAIALITWTFVSKVMSLLFNMLCTFVIAFFPRSRHLNFMAAVTVHSDLGAQENKICHCFLFPPLLFAMKWWDQMPWY